MLRQHFYPKTYFRHRSLSKSYQTNQEQSSLGCIPSKQLDIECTRIHYIKPKASTANCSIKPPLNQRATKSKIYQAKIYQQPKQSTQWQQQQKSSIKGTVKLKFSQQVNSQLQSIQQTLQEKSILKQLNMNGSNNYNSANTQDKHTRQPYQIIVKKGTRTNSKQEDIHKLFIKSDRKAITNPQSHKSHPHIHNQENSYLEQQPITQNQTLSIKNPYRLRSTTSKSKTYRKLSSAEGSYQRSMSRNRKKPSNTPQEIIISSSINMSTLDKKPQIFPDHKKPEIFSERPSQLVHFPRQSDKAMDHFINLNLSKAIKYRQGSFSSGNHGYEKLLNGKKRKMSHKINLEDIENRNFQLQQKVKGWEIVVEDDADFENNQR